MPRMRRQPKEDPWSLLASQSSWIQGSSLLKDSVAQILIAVNNKKSQLSGGESWEIREAERSAPGVLTSTNAQTKGVSLSSVWLPTLQPQIAMSSCLLLPYIPLSAQPNHSFLHLPSAGVKGVWS